MCHHTGADVSGSMSLTAIDNIITVTQSDPLSHCDPLFQDIVTAENLHALIMASFSSDDARDMYHFIMTPIDEIEPG